MESLSEKRVNKELLNSLNEEMNFKLATSLERYNYISPFDGLPNWHIFPSLAINRS